jgi:hypothetical protein
VPEPEPEPETTVPEPEPEPATEEDLGGSGSTDGEVETVTVPEPEPETKEQTVTASITLVGKAPTKEQYKAQMEAQFAGSGATVEIALVQKATIPMADPDGTFCGENATDGILDATEKGLGRSVSTYNGTDWSSGCIVAASCTSSRRRLSISESLRRLTSHQSVSMATTSTDDISQHVSDTNFATSLQTQITTEADAASLNVTVPAVAVTAAAISYVNDVTYKITSPASDTTVTTTSVASSLGDALTGALTAASVDTDLNDISTLVTAAAAAATVEDTTASSSSSTGSTDTGDVSSASAAAAFASVATACAAALALF